MTGLRAAPDMSEPGRALAVEADAVDSTDLVDAVDMFEAVREGAVGGAMGLTLTSALRLAMDLVLAGNMAAMAVMGLGGGCCFAARLSAAILSLKEERAPPGLPLVDAVKLA